MASSATTPSPNPPLSLLDEDEEQKKWRKRWVDRDSSSSQHTSSHLRRKIKNQRNRTLQENRMTNFSLDPNSTSSEDEDEMKRQRSRKSLCRLRKSNKTTLNSIGGTMVPIVVAKNLDISPYPSLLHPPLHQFSDNEDEESGRCSMRNNSNIDTLNLTNDNTYSFKWKEQKDEIGSEIETFLKTGIFADVTLICDGEGEVREEDERNDGIRAHKVILAASSEYFRRILLDSPCKHSVFVLKGFQKWEVETLVQFMYRGQVTIETSHVNSLLRAADELQIYGIRDCLGKNWSDPVEGMMGRKESSSLSSCMTSKPLDPRALGHNCDNNEDVKLSEERRNRESDSPKLLNLSMNCGSVGEDGRSSSSSRQEGRTSRDDDGVRNEPQTTKAHHPAFSIHQHHHQPHQQTHSASSPPFPRRKQARPRRRSGDFIAQDLRVSMSPSITSDPSFNPTLLPFGYVETKNGTNENDTEETVLDFTINRHPHPHQLNNNNYQKQFLERMNEGIPNQFIKNWQLVGGIDMSTVIPIPSLSIQKRHSMKGEIESDGVVLSPVDTGHYQSPPGTPPVVIPGRRIQTDKVKQSKRSKTFPNINGHTQGLVFKGSPPSPNFIKSFNNGPQPQSDSESNNTETCSTPPTIFSPAGGGFPIPSPANGGKKNNDSIPAAAGQSQWPGLPLGSAPIFGRHRAQHSAPRGGPPRAWSNADLTEALHNVWHRKMTTSQASRIFGIPYNSLLMYVRGKYGKSLQLDLLKKGVDLAMENSAAANSKSSSKVKSQPSRGGRGSASPSNSSPSSNNATPPHNNNNNNNESIKSKGGVGRSSPLGTPPSMNLSTLLTQGLGRQSPEPIRFAHHRNSPEGNNPLGEMMPPGFNPFSMGSIFGEYPQPFPFPSVAAANAALSHILPPHPHQLLPNSHRRIHQNGPGDK